MLAQFSAQFMADIRNSVETARARDGIVNVIALAEELRKRNESENIALEDVEVMVLRMAQSYNAAIELSGGGWRGGYGARPKCSAVFALEDADV